MIDPQPVVEDQQEQADRDEFVVSSYDKLQRAGFLERHVDDGKVMYEVTEAGRGATWQQWQDALQ